MLATIVIICGDVRNAIQLMFSIYCSQASQVLVHSVDS
jgi:hypothetical protein